MSAIDEMTLCTACGAQVPAGSAVCVECGAVVRRGTASLPRASAITAPSAPSAPAPVSAPAPAPTGTAALAAVATAATAAAAVAAAKAAAAQSPSASRAVAPPKFARSLPTTWPDAAAANPPVLTSHQAELAHTLAEMVGIPESEAARVFADSRGDTSLSHRLWRPRRGFVSLVVVLAFLGMQAWRCADEHGTTTYSTSPNAYDASGSASNIPLTGARAELRRMLDDLMAVDASLPATVDKPLPAASQRAAELGRQLKKWQRTHTASPDDALLAAAGVRFAFALSDWTDHPGVSGSYKAYERAWNAWDRVDDTWKTAD